MIHGLFWSRGKHYLLKYFQEGRASHFRSAGNENLKVFRKDSLSIWRLSGKKGKIEAKKGES